MGKLSFLLVVLFLAAPVLGACISATPSPSAGKAPPVAGGAAPATGASWQEKWNTLLAEAKKEGTVMVYSMWAPELRVALFEAMRDKYGLTLEFSSFGTSSEIGAKVGAEKAAGLYLADVYGTGVPAAAAYTKPQGLLRPIRPLLILPEVLDPKVWLGGALPFADKDELIFPLIGSTLRTVVYNTSMIKEGEITTYKDFLKPQYKGKIIMLDPSTAANASLAHVGHNLWGEEETVNFLRRLIKDQEVVITRDNRLHLETVARGKYAIAFAPSQTLLPSFLTAGAPISLATVAEDNRLSANSGALGVSVRTPHPNATIVFVNWLLTREGQSVFATNFGNPGTRLDASKEGINPIFVPIPGKKYYLADEPFLEASNRYIDIFRKVIAETTR